MSDIHVLRNDFLNQLKKFIIENNIIGTCAGVIIALTTKDLILSFVGDIIIPLFIFLFLKINIKWLTAILPSGKSNFDLTDFIKKLVTWIVTLIVTFLFIKATFESLLGITSEKKKEMEKKKRDGK